MFHEQHLPDSGGGDDVGVCEPVTRRFYTSVERDISSVGSEIPLQRFSSPLCFRLEVSDYQRADWICSFLKQEGQKNGQSILREAMTPEARRSHEQHHLVTNERPLEDC